MTTLPAVITHHGVVLDLADRDDRIKLSELKTSIIRLRNYGGSVACISEKLGLDEAVTEALMSLGIKELTLEDAQAIRGRQQQMIHDMYAALGPSLEDPYTDMDVKVKVVNSIKGVLEYEGKLHGVTAPTKIQLGMDQQTFTTRVDEDIRALGISPVIDVELEEDDGTWSNT